MTHNLSQSLGVRLFILFIDVLVGINILIAVYAFISAFAMKMGWDVLTPTISPLTSVQQFTMPGYLCLGVAAALQFLKDLQFNKSSNVWKQTIYLITSIIMMVLAFSTFFNA